MDLTQKFPLPEWRHEYQYLMKTWQARNLQPEQKIQLHHHIIEFNYRQVPDKIDVFPYNSCHANSNYTIK